MIYLITILGLIIGNLIVACFRKEPDWHSVIGTIYDQAAAIGILAFNIWLLHR